MQSLAWEESTGTNREDWFRPCHLRHMGRQSHPSRHPVLKRLEWVVAPSSSRATLPPLYSKTPVRRSPGTISALRGLQLSSGRQGGVWCSLTLEGEAGVVWEHSKEVCSIPHPQCFLFANGQVFVPNHIVNASESNCQGSTPTSSGREGL